jgi:hypothetical protein
MIEQCANLVGEISKLQRMVINFKGFGLEVDLSSHEYQTFKVTEDTGGKGNPQANILGNTTYMHKYPSK